MAKERYVILGKGIIGPFGAGVPELKKRLQEKYSFWTEHDRSRPLTPNGVLARALPPNAPRRTDHFSKLAIAAASMTMEAAGGTAPNDMGLIVGTGYGPIGSTCGFKDTFINSNTLGASPTMFTKSVHSQACSHLAMLLNIHGPAVTVCQHHFPFQTALQLACLWLDEGRVKYVLVGGVDEYSDHLDYCRRRLISERSSTGHVLETAKIPTEGGAFFLLTKKSAEVEKASFSKITFTGLCRDKTLWLIERRRDGSTITTNDILRNTAQVFGSHPTVAAMDCIGLSVNAPQGSRCHMVEYYGKNSCSIELIAGE